MELDDMIADVATRLAAVPGIVGVTLGGSRARGTHHPLSDVDLGLYYEGAIDLEALAALARATAGPSAAVSDHGGWGPWVDGGAWLSIGGVPVDWIYRDVDRVQAGVDAALRGVTTRHHQLGHPFGVPEYQYAAELAVDRILADPSGRLRGLARRTNPYPEPLRTRLIDHLDDARFLTGIARKALPRRDSVYIAGCLFEALTIAANAILASARTWVTNEKGAVAAADRLPVAPPGFAVRCNAVIDAIGASAESLERAIADAERLVDATGLAVHPDVH